MSSSDPGRRAVLLGGLALVAGCGFAPAYGPSGVAEGLRGKVSFADPGDKDTFELVRALEEKLGRPQLAAYELTYRLDTRIEGAGVTATNAITRYSLVGTVDWELHASGGKGKLASGRASSFTNWSTTGSTVSALAAEDDAHLRLMRILADQITTQLIAAAPGLAR